MTKLAKQAMQQQIFANRIKQKKMMIQKLKRKEKQKRTKERVQRTMIVKHQMFLVTSQTICFNITFF